jgi:hypothetical protein
LIHVRSLKVRKPHFFKFKGTGFFKKLTKSAKTYKEGWQLPTKKLFRGRRNRRNNWFVPAEFRRSAEQKTLEIPFRTVQQRRRMLGILYPGTKIEENSRISVLNHSADQKTLRIPFRTVPQRRKMLRITFLGKNRSKLSEFCSEACLRQKHAVSSVYWSTIF